MCLLLAVIHQVEHLLTNLLLFGWSLPFSFNMIEYFLRSDRDAPLIVMATLRSDDQSNPPYVVNFIHQHRSRLKMMQVSLTPLSQDETYDLLIDAHVPSNVSIERIYEDSGGNPLFINEISSQSAPHSSFENFEFTLHSLMIRRILSLSPNYVQVLNVLAVLGKSAHLSFFMIEVEDQNQIGSILDYLLQQRLIKRTDQNFFDFYHDRLRQTVVYGKIKVHRMAA